MLQESRRRKFTAVAVLTMIASTVLTSAFLDAALIAQYRLLDHPDGNAGPPPYGLRLDGMGSKPGPGTLPSGKYLFSAEVDSYLTLDVIEDDMTGFLSMRIHGKMYGGLKDGTSLDSVLRGPAVVDFTYRQNVEDLTGTAGDVLYNVSDQDHDLTGGNTGTIMWTDADGTGTTHMIYLQDKSNGSFSARLAYDHRTVDPDVPSFWGWVNHSTVPGSGDYTHISASDWLMTASPIPEPATVICLGIGAAAAGLARRRRQRAKTEAS